jgi:hypothetical protein
VRRLPRHVLSSFVVAVTAALVVAPAAALAIPTPNPPTIAIAFGAPTLGVGASTSLTFTITNPNSADSLSGIGFTDGLPGGLVVATPSGASGTCGGGAIVDGAGASSVSLSGATLAAAAGCSFSVNVTADAPGVQTNTTGKITSIESGDGGTATASVTVGYQVTLGMSYNPTSVPLNGTSTLTFTLYNPEFNSVDLTGLGFSVTLPAELTIPDGSQTVCPATTDTEGGPVTVSGSVSASGGHTVTLSGLSLPVSWSCSFSVTVTGPATDGVYTATTGAVTSDNGIPGNAATAFLIVGNPDHTPPPTSVDQSVGPAPSSNPALLLILLMAFVAGFVAVRRAAIRSTRPDPR